MSSPFDGLAELRKHPAPLFVVPAGAKLVRVPGNIDVMRRPAVRNPDGSVSSVFSATYGTPQGVYVLPRVVGNAVVSEGEAWQHFLRTGQHLGLFRNEADAKRYSDLLHLQQAALMPRPHV